MSNRTQCLQIKKKKKKPDGDKIEKDTVQAKKTEMGSIKGRGGTARPKSLRADAETAAKAGRLFLTFL